MLFVNLWLDGLLLLLPVVTVLWLLSLKLRNAAIADIFWGSGFVLLAAFYCLQTPDGPLPRKVLLLALVAVWGLRLTIHLFLRNRGKPEDFRYAKWRQQYGHRWWWRSYLQVFVLQGLLMWLISAPLLAAQLPGGSGAFAAFDIIGAVIWLIGFYFEAAGDWQLTRFKANPENAGKVLDTGVWRYTRHPNYFGDAVQWWGFYLIAVANGGWWSIFSPLVMTYLLLKVSGVAMLESELQKRKPDYQRYIRRTNAFFPWFPKSPSR